MSKPHAHDDKSRTTTAGRTFGTVAQRRNRNRMVVLAYEDGMSARDIGEALGLGELSRTGVLRIVRLYSNEQQQES